MKKKEAKKKITRKTMIGEIVEKYPKLAEVLVKKYNFHCVGCYAAAMETLEEGAGVHGMSRGEITKMVAELNKKLK